MELRRLPAEEDAVRRYVEELWLPYHRELEATVEGHALADDVDLVSEETAFRLDRLDSDGHRTWIAVASEATDERDLAEADGDFAGFVTTDLDASPPVFDRPDRLIVGDLFVHEPYRGTGLARDLVERATKRARRAGCEELALDVDVDSDRAVAFYRKLGFETYRRRMAIRVDDLDTIGGNG